MRKPFHRDANLVIFQGDVRDVLRELPSESVQCVVTSPPYWGLRSYGVEPGVWGERPELYQCPVNLTHEWIAAESTPAQTGGMNGKQATHPGSVHYGAESDTCTRCGAWRGALGLEPTPALFVEHIVEVFREVRRVLRPDGTLWLNLGDSYAASGPAGGAGKQHTNVGSIDVPVRKPSDGLKPKDLVGIPWRVAFALQADGWWLRQDIIWSKPNPMPESVTDRCTKAHEYMFLLSKSERYYYDAAAIAEPANRPEGSGNLSPYTVANQRDGENSNLGGSLHLIGPRETRNKRSVWEIATESYAEAHFATFPQALVRPCIQAGTSAHGACSECGAPWERVTEQSQLVGPGHEGYRLPKAQAAKGDSNIKGRSEGWWPNHRYDSTTTGWRPTCTHTDALVRPCVVLDPFMGSGTTGLVAKALDRRAIGIDLSEEYIKLAVKRTQSLTDTLDVEEYARTRSPDKKPSRQPRSHADLVARGLINDD